MGSGTVELQITMIIYNIKLFLMIITSNRYCDFVLDKLLGKRIVKYLHKDAFNFLTSRKYLNRFLLSFSETRGGCLGRCNFECIKNVKSKQLFTHWYLIVDNDYINNCLFKICIRKYENRFKRCTT